MSRIKLLHQAGALRACFPQSTISRNGEDEITWVGTLRPTPLSGIYKVKLHYSRKKGVAIYVLEPKLALAKGCTRLPHVYDHEKQKLCLYYPNTREWHAGLWFVKTIIPWASEWLYYYELWLATDGQWLGGGIEHDQPEEGNRKEQIDENNGTGQIV
jgi:hypothetical protein